MQSFAEEMQNQILTIMILKFGRQGPPTASENIAADLIAHAAKQLLSK